jgi:hypothetical protein
MSQNYERETAMDIITQNIGPRVTSNTAGPNVGQSRLSGNSQQSSGNNQPSSSSRTNANSDFTVTNSSTTNEPALDIVRELDRIVEQFRNKTLTKSRAIASITSKLGFNIAKEEPEKDAALDQYLSTIESIERLALEAIRRGTNAVFEPGRNNLERQNQSTNHECGIEETATFIKPSSSKRNHNREPTDPDDSSDSSSSSDSDDERGSSSKKKRIFEKDMPWYSRENFARQSGEPSSVESRRIILHIGDNIPAVKKWISVAHTAPRGFPPSEWENIAKGKSVNLDVILSSLHHIAPIKENVGHVGSTEISLGRTEPTRRVQTSGEWTSAWNSAIKATTFIFPHRERELRDYGDYIDREFSSKVVEAHRKIILYDAAVRSEVGGGQNILLTDRHQFQHLYSAIVMPDGIESRFGQGAYSSGTNKSQPEICRRFNSANGCPNKATNCRYRHVCARCKRRDHGEKDCEKGEGKTSKKSVS